MASTLLRRQLARAHPRIASPSLSHSPSRLAPSIRPLSSTPVARLAEPHQDPAAGARSTGARNVFETHTVEDLQGMHAADILAETGSRKEAQMRHFTGELGRMSKLVPLKKVIDDFLYSELWV